MGRHIDRVQNRGRQELAVGSVFEFLGVGPFLYPVGKWFRLWGLPHRQIRLFDRLARKLRRVSNSLPGSSVQKGGGGIGRTES